MSRKCASPISTPEVKRQRLSLKIVVDDLYDLPNVPSLSPLLSTDEKVSSDEEISSDEEFHLSSKWCRRAENGWMLPGEDKDELRGISWKSMWIRVFFLKGTNSQPYVIEENPPVMRPLSNNLAKVINKINESIIRNYEDSSNPLFLTNGTAFYDNLFMQAMLDEVKAEKIEKREAMSELQENFKVSTIRFNKKSQVPLLTNLYRMTQPMC